MSVLDNNTIGTLESNIDVGELLLPDNQIAIATSYQGMGVMACIFVNSNNIFSLACMLLGLGAAAYRIDDGAFLNVQQADVDTIGIVDGQEVERQHQAPRIIRFQKK